MGLYNVVLIVRWSLDASGLKGRCHCIYRTLHSAILALYNERRPDVGISV